MSIFFYILVTVKLILKSLKSSYSSLKALVLESEFQAKLHLFKHLCRQDFEAVLCVIIEGGPGKKHKVSTDKLPESSSKFALFSLLKQKENLTLHQKSLRACGRRTKLLSQNNLRYRRHLPADHCWLSMRRKTYAVKRILTLMIISRRVVLWRFVAISFKCLHTKCVC